MRLPLSVMLTSVLVGCSSPPAPAPVTPAAPAEQAAAASTPPQPPPESVSRADALVEDMRRREAAFKKMESEMPAVPAPRMEDYIRPAAAPPSTPTPATVSAVAASSSLPAPAAAPALGKDEAWWKNEMRTAEVRLADNVRRLQEANDQRAMAQRQMSIAVDAGARIFAQAQEAFNRANAEVQRLEAEVRNDHAAVERVREDARRAGVPPGWLRWP